MGACEEHAEPLVIEFAGAFECMLRVARGGGKTIGNGAGEPIVARPIDEAVTRSGK